MKEGKIIDYNRVMQDDRSGKVHKSLSMQLSRIAAEKAAKSVDSLKRVRQSVASQVFGPKSRYAQSDSSTQAAVPKPFEFGFSVLNELKKINVLKNPMSRPSSISEYLASKNTRQSPAAVKSKTSVGSPTKPSSKPSGFSEKP